MGIKQIIPAVGWRAITAIHQGDKVEFDEEPLIAWATTDANKLVPLVWDAGVVNPVAEAVGLPNWAVDILGPGEELTEERKKRLRERIENQLAEVQRK